MKLELFMASRLVRGKENKKGVASSVVRIAVAAVALSVCVMIVSISVIVGFRNEIMDKVIGFGSCVNIINRESAANLESLPIDSNQEFYPSIEDEDGVRHIQRYALKPCIFKSGTDIMGVMLKGVGEEYDWSFFEKNLVAGHSLAAQDTVSGNRIVVSKKMADMLNLEVGGSVIAYFIQDPPRMRKYNIVGIYSTGLEDCDKMFAMVDIAGVQKINGWNENQITGFEVMIDNIAELEMMTEVVRGVAGYKIAEDGSMLRVSNVHENNRQLFDWITLTEMNVWVIIAIMVFVAFVNMSTALLIIIFEKASMIGLMKAIGARNWQIRKVFILQSLYILMKGLIIGNLIAFALIALQHYTGIIALDADSYYVDHVPCTLNFWHFAVVDLGTLVLMTIMMTLPSLAIGLMQPAKVMGFK
ncbi:MAG: ABC transporter permease [Bacteroidales bacterium]|nr:ABC transporter permease [Bacteroidales bacterium]